MKIVITGGHLSPALAVISAFPKDTDVLIVGRKHAFEGDNNLSFEYRTAKQHNIAFRAITTGRLQRTFTIHTLPSLLKLPIGMLQSFVILWDFKPDVVLSFGGYVSLPVVLCAAALKIPVVIHEQTLGAGLANKIAARFAKKICISWETSEKYFPKKKVVFTGNPIRKFTVQDMPFAFREKLPILYVTGGSAGSHTINSALEGILPKLLDRFNIIHQTGESEFGDYDRLVELRESIDDKRKARYIIEKFIDTTHIGSIMTHASLVVSRSGMNTITELIYFSKAAILIPLNKEQKENALFFRDVSLGEIIDQNTLTKDILYEKIMSVYQELEQHAMPKDARNLVIADAAQKIVAVVASSVQ